MHIEEIKLGNLAEFVSSAQFMQAENIPITLHRAMSQIKNPRSNSDDVILIAAYDESNELLAYVGALPDIIFGSHKVAWNSCWYAHPQKGKTIALPLFYQFMKQWKGRIIMQDLTEHTTSIIKTLPFFDFIGKFEGSRIFFRSYLAELIQVQRINGLLKIIDSIINGLIYLRQYTWKIIYSVSNNLSIDPVAEIDDELEKFIINHQEGEICKRGKTELKWIINNPWVLEETSENKELINSYYFSSVAKSFSIKALKILKNSELIGLIIVKERNRHISLPYIYYSEKDNEIIRQIMMHYFIEQKYLSLTWFNKKFCDHSALQMLPYIFRKKIQKDLVISKELKELFTGNFVIQDGDGDVAFT